MTEYIIICDRIYHNLWPNKFASLRSQNKRRNKVTESYQECQLNFSFFYWLVCQWGTNALMEGSRSTFKFPSQVNLSGPSLYCVARTLGKKSRHSIGLAGATRLTRSDFKLNLLLLKCQGCVGKNKDVLVGQHLELLLKHQNMQNKEKQHHFIILEQKRCQFLFCLILSKVFELFAKHVKINRGIFFNLFA